MALKDLSLNPTNTDHIDATQELQNLALQTGTFTPVLLGTTTSPDLGTGAATFGRWTVYPTDHSTDDLVVIEAAFLWGTSPSVGSGTYVVEIPALFVPSFPLEALGFSSDDGGYGVCVDASGTGDLAHANLYVGIDSDLAALGHASAGISGVLVPVLDYDQLDGFSVSNYVTTITPWSWAAGDQLRVTGKFWVDRSASTY